MSEKQQQLLFDKGITNVPSDVLCSDNALEESMGMFYDNGEHRVVQKPVSFMKQALTVLYTHRYNDNARYITKDSNSIKWGTNDNGTFIPAQEEPLITTSGDVRVSSIGKTLIISDDNGLHYFIWKDNTYSAIAYPIPDIEFEAKLVDEPQGNDKYGMFVLNAASPDGMLEPSIVGQPTITIIGGKHEDYNNLVVGQYSKNLKSVAQSKCFSKPFFVRAALELYDGTYTNITSPILLFPSITENTKFYLYQSGEQLFMTCATQMLRLYIRQKTDFSNYSDIIKDVVIFASRGIEIYSTEQDQPATKEENNYTVGNNISSEEINIGQLNASVHRNDTFTPPEVIGWSFVTTIRGLKNREARSINSDIESTSVFYKIASVGIKNFDNFIDIASKTTAEIIENLEVQEALDSDDYFSHSALVPSYLYSYNSRLNLANVSRDFYEGSGYFLPLDQETPFRYIFDVTIQKDDGAEATVRHIEVSTTQKQGIYFYYPDSRAKHVVIYKEVSGGTYKIILDADLKEHPFLNGAYYFAGMTESTDEPIGVSANVPAYNRPLPEMLPNYIIQSEVNNPFVFKASGYFKVATGKIVGMSTITQALSEGQFGQFPLLVFSETGIWSLSVDSTGYYDSVHPISREVAILDNPCITQTDGAVFFASNKGLMVVVSSEVKCVSEQLSGKSAVPFKDYIKSAFIAYDYRDSLLWIFDGHKEDDVLIGSRYCYLYSIKTGTFSRYDFDGDIVKSVVNNYPDYLLQSGTNVYSLLDRPDINADGTTSGGTFTPNRYSGQIITRPMKFENSLALKSLMDVRNIRQFDADEYGNPPAKTLQLTVKASNDLKHWYTLSSLRSVPWKYFKFQYDFNHMIATDRFAGAVIITQERRTDKLR